MHNNDLILKCKEDSALLGEFLQENRDFMFSIITKYKGNTRDLRYKFGVSDEELYQQACIAIINALRTFDFEKGIKFTTYIVRPIIWEVNQLLYSDSQLIRLSRGAVELVGRIKEVENNLGYLPTEDELERILNVPRDKIADIILFSHDILSIDAEIERNFSCQPKDSCNIEDEAIDKVYVHQLMHETALTDFEKSILIMIKDEGLNNSQIANNLGVYPMTVNRAIERIRSKLENTYSDERKFSKYESEIQLLVDEMIELGELIEPDNVCELLEVCGYDVSDLTPRICYYIRQKAIGRYEEYLNLPK